MQKKCGILCLLVSFVMLFSMQSACAQSVNHWEMVVAAGIPGRTCLVVLNLLPTGLNLVSKPVSGRQGPEALAMAIMMMPP